jgi:hypothetical protein
MKKFVFAALTVTAVISATASGAFQRAPHAQLAEDGAAGWSLAVAVFSLGIGSPYAGDGDGNSATTLFTSIQNRQAAPARSVATPTPTIAAPTGGAAVQGPDARSQGKGRWLFHVFSLS